MKKRKKRQHANLVATGKDYPPIGAHIVFSRTNAEMPNAVQDLLVVDDTSFPYIFEQNATVTLQSGHGLIRCNVYRPKGSKPVPVLVTYGPYGKDIYYEE